ISIHVAATGKQVPYHIAAEEVRGRLPHVLRRGLTATVYWWKERPAGVRLHNRYVLSDVGGVKFGDGIERGATGQQDLLSVVGDADRQKLLNDFAQDTAGYDTAGAPILVTGVLP